MARRRSGFADRLNETLETTEPHTFQAAHGVPGCSSADSTPPGLSSHSHLEPGIRLVQRCIDVLGCLTYRGCEGHPPVGDSGLRFRHVGIVARDAHEHATCQELLRGCATRANSAIGTSSRVVVEICESELHSDATSPRPAIDIVFAPQPDLAPCDYFEHLATTYSEFYHQLRQGVEDLTATHSANGHGDTSPRPRDGMPVGALEGSTNTDFLSAVRQFYDIALSWHCKEPADPSGSGCIAAQALRLHAINFALWHHEDAVRRPGVDDHEVARRKRRIDDLNARRNAAIEDIDETLLDRTDLNHSAPLYTETPATIVDRLSVLTLRILHTNRTEQPTTRLEVLEEQYDDLFGSLEELLARMQAGEIRFKLYRQFKSAAQRSYCALFEARDT
jgi:Protein of unknown function (DUF4254)